ncbi:conserved hypothetical protein [Beggiatoa sp. PS]|nr:conserved hypothetical protein [Beggiatoa sp. PS]
MVAYESGDPGNIAHAIMSLFNDPIYNHHNYVILSDYGWVLGDISFIVVFLFKIVGQLMGFYDQPIFGTVDDQAIFNGAIRMVNFTFAMASILLFFRLSHLLFENKKVSFIASLFFMFIPWAAIYSYWLHPDASGMVFMMIALLSVVKFVKQEQKLIYFFIALASLELATLSKPPYFFLSIPVLLIFLFNYCHKTHLKYLTFLISPQFFKISIASLQIAIFILFIVHPYSIIEFSQAYNIQRLLFGIYQNISITQSFYNWFYIYKNEPLIYINVFLLYLLIIPLFFKQKFSISFLFVTSVLFCNIFLLITIWGMRYNMTARYMYPIAPLLILNIVAFIIFVWNKLNFLLIQKKHYLKIILTGLGILYLLPIFTENILATINSLLARAAYKHTTFYQTRKFLLNNPNTFSQHKMLFDMGMAIIPPKMTWVVPHASVTWVPSKVINQERYYKYINPNAQVIWVPWESQSQSLKFIKDNNINPLFLILNKGRYNAYRHYIAKNHFRMIKTITASNKELASLSYWFPRYGNTQLKNFNFTLKLIELHRNPNLIIGPTMMFYRNGRN